MKQDIEKEEEDVSLILNSISILNKKAHLKLILSGLFYKNY
jgi:hypothetical protein